MPDNETRSALERAALVAAALTALVLAGIFLWSGEIAEFKWINHDAANALYIGERVLHGDRLYLDWYYFVMPPIVFLGSLPGCRSEKRAPTPAGNGHRVHSYPTGNAPVAVRLRQPSGLRNVSAD